MYVINQCLYADFEMGGEEGRVYLYLATFEEKYYCLRYICKIGVCVYTLRSSTFSPE